MTIETPEAVHKLQRKNCKMDKQTATL